MYKYLSLLGHILMSSYTMLFQVKRKHIHSPMWLPFLKNLPLRTIIFFQPFHYVHLMESGKLIAQNVVLIIGKTNKEINSYYYNYHHNPISTNTFSAEPFTSVILSQEWIFDTVTLLLCYEHNVSTNGEQWIIWVFFLKWQPFKLNQTQKNKGCGW